MATLTGFTRPSDPIEESSISTQISTAIGISVTVKVLPNDVQVTGSITESNRSAIQTAITNYIYPMLQYGSPLSDNPDMSGSRHDRGVTEHAAFMADKSVAQIAQTQSDWSQSDTTAVDYIKNKPSTMSQSSATRSLNSAFQVSTTRNANVSYSVSISNTLTLSGGSAGVVILEIATNSAFTTGVQELGRVANSNTGTLVVGLTLNDATNNQLHGYVPAGYYVRLRTSNTTGTPSYTYISGQEVWL